jgi:hypothetical protein
VSGEGLGFSSPTTVSDGIHSSPSFAPSVSAPIDRSEYEDRVKSEEVSRALASEFLGVVCDLTRDPALDRNSSCLEFTPESHTYKIPPLNATCVDDGSFVFKRIHKGTWQRQDLNAYCCLEAKRIHDTWEEEGEDDVGVVTNEVFAQQVGEILGMAFRRMDSSQILSDAERQCVGYSKLWPEKVWENWWYASCFLVSAHQNIHRLLYAYLSDEYISYLKGSSVAVIDDSSFLKVWESREYDHCKPDDRVSEAAELKAMIDFIELSIQVTWKQHPFCIPFKYFDLQSAHIGLEFQYQGDHCRGKQACDLHLRVQFAVVKHHIDHEFAWPSVLA